MISRVLALVLLSFSLALASFSTDLDTLAMKMADALKLSPQEPLSITTINLDKNYMLPLDPILLKLKEKLNSYSKSVAFNPFRGEENATIRSIVLSGGAEYEPIPMNERKIDSLLLTGYYTLNGNDSLSVNFQIKIIDYNAHVLFESDEYTINKQDCSPAIKREIFEHVSNKEKFNELEYRGKIIKDLDDLFHHTPNSNLLASPVEYRFEKKNPYAVGWQVELLKDILSRQYGITICPKSSNAITIEQSHSVIFTHDGKQYSRANLVEGESNLPDTFAQDTTYNTVNNGDNTISSEPEDTKVEERKCNTQQEKNMIGKIYETFNITYPSLFNPFNYAKLDEVFIDQGTPSILTGTKVVDNPSSGKEVVKYTWQTKRDWLNSLKDAVEKRNRSFDVKTSVMGVFMDNLDQNRFWAIVKQKWQTKDMYGHVVYQDDGFLIVNFDFAADTLKDFKIYYRHWFYDYQYDDVERGTKRYTKLVKDINTYFAEDSVNNKISGISKDLKVKMRDYLIQQVKTFNGKASRLP